jgi:predicted metal-dependent phosphoesterase TrpH
MTVIDLHCHTTASDGTLSPQDLVARALRDSVDVIAVTDHDTTDGIDEAIAAGVELGVRVVTGIELSARTSERNVHVLGYFIDPTSLELRAALTELRESRLVRAHGIVERLGELGYAISIADVEAQAGAGRVIARPHIARALVAKGLVSSMKEAFGPQLLADGGRADVPKETLTPADAVRLIRTASGAPVIAHAAVGHHDGVTRGIPVELIDEMCAAGMAGIEIDHPDHPPLIRDRLRALADERSLVVTGGSDFHGDPGHALGNYRTAPDQLEALEAAAT